MQRTPEPSTVLLEEARSGDARAFTEIVRRYEQLVYSFAFKVCRDRQKAAETLQDTFVNLYRKLGQFDGKSKFTTWLYSIVANNCLMKHRRRKLEEFSVPIHDLAPAHEEGEMHLIQPWKSSPLDRVMNRELRELLDRAIAKLPLSYRAVFILRDVEGVSAAETARMLKISVPAMKSRLRRARMFLREELNPFMTS
jgi:RNA polymerase sigma-70 factor (ECF subfamily)